MRVTVIISTYNQPAWLDKVLCGYSVQTYTDFDVVIADDGSSDETARMIKNYQENSSLKITHVWHEDDGFRKCVILNKAIVASEGDYLIFADGDCIPRADFVETHIKNSEKGRFLSGGAYRLTQSASDFITNDHINTQECFKTDFLHAVGQKKSFIKDLKCSASPHMGAMLNRITPAGATWNGGNSSAWRTDILSVGGYDERMRYGAEDREMGERLMNSGIKGKQVRFSAICLHLEHGRGYVNKEDWDRNRAIWKDTKKTKRTRTEYGIK